MPQDLHGIPVPDTVDHPSEAFHRHSHQSNPPESIRVPLPVLCGSAPRCCWTRRRNRNRGKSGMRQSVSDVAVDCAGSARHPGSGSSPRSRLNFLGPQMFSPSVRSLQRPAEACRGLSGADILHIRLEYNKTMNHFQKNVMYIVNLSQPFFSYTVDKYMKLRNKK